MVGSFVSNSHLWKRSGAQVMIIFGSHVGPHISNIEYFEVYASIYGYMRVYEVYEGIWGYAKCCSKCFTIVALCPSRSCFGLSAVPNVVLLLRYVTLLLRYCCAMSRYCCAIVALLLHYVAPLLRYCCAMLRYCCAMLLYCCAILRDCCAFH